MQVPLSKPVAFRFGPFEVNLEERELRRSGVRIRLQNQPFQILTELMHRSGEIVDREDLRKAVWPENTFVDFERGLNAAINKLRQSLGDSAVTPHYIETVAGRGYRFLAPVEVITAPEPRQSEHLHPIVVQTLGGVSRNRYAILATFLAALLIGGVMGWFMSHRQRNPSTSEKRRFHFRVTMPKGSSDELAFSHQGFALAPDGSHLAFISGSQLYLHDLSSEQTSLLTAEPNVTNFTWSHDGRSIYYTVFSNLRKISVHGGASTLICELPPNTPWLTLVELKEDLAIFIKSGEVLLVPNAGGELRKVQLENSAYLWPQLLSGEDLLYVSFDQSARKYRLWKSNLRTPTSKQLILETDSRAQYVVGPTAEEGYVLYIRAGTLVAQPFDAKRARTVGEARPIVDNVFWFQPTAAAAFSASETGVLAYQHWNRRSQLMWVDRNGRELSKIGEPRLFLTPIRLSPDENRLAAGVYDPRKGGADIWVYDLHQQVEMRLTETDGHSASPIWAPDNERIAFLTAMAGSPQIYRTSLATRRVDRFFPAAQGEFQLPTDWSRDGHYLAYQTAGSAQTGVSVNMVATESGKGPSTVLRSSSKETEAVFSPDARWLAYISSNTGQDEAYVQGLKFDPEPEVVGLPIRASTVGASVIRWRPDGKELFFLDRNHWLCSTKIDSKNGQITVGAPIRLFQFTDVVGVGSVATGFDVSHNGERFLITRPIEAAPPAIEVVVNWQTAFD